MADDLIITLTDAEVKRIEEISARGTFITDHIWAALTSKLVDDSLVPSPAVKGDDE